MTTEQLLGLLLLLADMRAQIQAAGVEQRRLIAERDALAAEVESLRPTTNGHRDDAEPTERVTT